MVSVATVRFAIAALASVAAMAFAVAMILGACGKDEPAPRTLVAVGAVSIARDAPTALAITRTVTGDDVATLTDAAGHASWSTPLGARVTAYGVLVELGSDADQIVIAVDQALVSLARSDGARRWQARFDDASSARGGPSGLVACGPVWLQVRERAVGGGPAVYALDRASGRVSWRWTGPATTPATSLGLDGRVYCRGERVIWLESGRVLALDAASGTPRWSESLVGRAFLFADRLIARTAEPDAAGWFSRAYASDDERPEPALDRALGPSRPAACWDDGQRRAILAAGERDLRLHVLGADPAAALAIDGAAMPDILDEPAGGTTAFVIVRAGTPALVRIIGGKPEVAPLAAGSRIEQHDAFALLVTPTALRRLDRDVAVDTGGDVYAIDPVAEGLWISRAAPTSNPSFALTFAPALVDRDNL